MSTSATWPPILDPRRTSWISTVPCKRSSVPRSPSSHQQPDAAATAATNPMPSMILQILMVGLLLWHGQETAPQPRVLIQPSRPTRPFGHDCAYFFLKCLHE